MLLLGWAVGTGSTRLDDWFHQYRYGPAKWLLFFTDPRVLAILVLGCMGVALYRRQWQLASAALLAPIVGIAIVRLSKPLFVRHNGTALSYPSGHTTAMVGHSPRIRPRTPPKLTRVNPAATCVTTGG